VENIIDEILDAREAPKGSYFESRSSRVRKSNILRTLRTLLVVFQEPKVVVAVWRSELGAVFVGGAQVKERQFKV
jgi:hypothetical protein